MSGTTTRPAGIGGIDLGGIDPAWAIFEATGGGYGNPQGGASEDALVGPSRTGDWITQDGRAPQPGDPLDGADPGKLVDPHRDIMLTTDPVMPANPLLGLMKEDSAFHFANGGPEGQSNPLVVAGVAGAVIVGGVIAYAASNDFKAAVDGAGAAARDFFDGLFTGGGDAAPEGKSKNLNGFDRKSNDAMNSAKQNHEPQYLQNPDADPAAPQDDAKVLGRIWTDLLGGNDIGTLAADPKAFVGGVGKLVDGFMHSHADSLGALISGLDGLGIEVRDGISGQELDDLAGALGLGGLLGAMPFGPVQDMQATLLPADAVLALFVTPEQTAVWFGQPDWW